MTAFALEVRSATRRYGDVVAVDGLDVRVEPGQIYGFLGLNGAGKTTTIRMLLGMVRPSSGSVHVLGQRIDSGRGPWGDVGHLVEAPTAYPELTVRENLEIARRLQHVADADATARVIELLRLGEYADRRAGTLSQGNLQRLGLARALLHRPRLVLLDEPANGLDPAGVVEVRGLLAGLARDEGVTVFMSSHVLAEVDRLATRVGIIHRGRLLEELGARDLHRNRERRLEVDARDRERAAVLLREAGYAPRVEADGLFLTEARAVDGADEVARLLVAGGAAPTRLHVEEEDLEQYFLRLTGGAA